MIADLYLVRAAAVVVFVFFSPYYLLFSICIYSSSVMLLVDR